MDVLASLQQVLRFPILKLGAQEGVCEILGTFSDPSFQASYAGEYEAGIVLFKYVDIDVDYIYL